MEKGLRDSHFNLGTMKDNLASIYTKDYNKKHVGSNQGAVGPNPFRSSSLANNFKMGEGQYTTTNRAQYPHWKNHEVAKLEEDKQRDLKTHHFNLGTYHQQSETTNKYFHNTKPLQERSKGFEAEKIKMRSHNHDFKEGPSEPLASVYHREFMKKQQTEVPVPVKNNGIRETHLVLGKEKAPMITSNSIDYYKKECIPVDKAKIPVSKLTLGVHATDFKTTNQIYHEAQPFEVSALPAETMKELRTTHFALGGSRPNYSTESSQYQAHPPSFTKPYQPALQMTSKSIAPNDRFYGQTTNQRQLPKRAMQPQEQFRRSDLGSGWKLGSTDPNTYTTETSSNYMPKTGQKPNVPVRAEETLVIGLDAPDYTTTNRATYTRKSLVGQARNNNNESSARGHHFDFSQHAPDKYITVYQDEYREDQDHKSKLFHR